MDSWRKQIDQFVETGKLLDDNSNLYKVFNRDFSNTFLKGDINIKADVSYRTDETYIRSVDAESNQPVGGQNLLGIKVAADYNLSRNFTASLYYDQNVTSYAISTLFGDAALGSVHRTEQKSCVLSRQR